MRAKNVIILIEHASRYFDVQILTDLVDDWNIFWLDGPTVYQHQFDGRKEAHACISELENGGGTDKAGSVPFIQRSQISSELVNPAVPDPFGEQLQNLDGFLPPDELRDLQENRMLHLIRISLPPCSSW